MELALFGQLAMRLATLAALFVLSACTCDRPEADREPQVTGPAAEPIAVRMGPREVRVRCVLECEAAGSELARLAYDCEHDPMSAPHHVSERRAMLHLGCCEEARAAFERACGLEGGLDACTSSWLALCDRGDPDADPRPEVEP